MTLFSSASLAWPSSVLADPRIDVFITPGGGSLAVRGQTAPGITVALRILRGSQVITETTTSTASGAYNFAPAWQNCPSAGYAWTLQPGDEVQVTAQGRTVETIVADLSAWVDPDAAAVVGRTDPNRSVEVWLYAGGSYSCPQAAKVYSQTVSADGSGAFVADFSSQVDLDRRGYAAVYARDANGNSTYYLPFHADHIGVSSGSSQFEGYLKPEVDWTVSLSRTGGIVSTQTGRSSKTGAYSGSFTGTIRAGDVILVNGGGVFISYNAVNLKTTPDHVADHVAGVTSAGRLVAGLFAKRTDGYVRTSCAADSACATADADASGYFTLTSGLDMARGDHVQVYAYDAEGNYQYITRPFPVIVANLSQRQIEGYWGDPGASLTVTLKTSTGTVRETRSGVQSMASDSSFYTWLNDTLRPADVVEISDGTVTQTTTINDLSVRLDGGSGHLTGSAHDGRLLAVLSDWRRDTGTTHDYCQETTVSGEHYDLTFSGAEVRGNDGAEVWNAGAEGHYTYGSGMAFLVTAEKGQDFVEGYSETPDSPITVTLRRDGSPVAACTGRSSAAGYGNGYYGCRLSQGTPITISQGDILQVETGDGDSTTLTVPELTVQANPAHNLIYGRAPAGEPVLATAYRYSNFYGGINTFQVVTVDTSGDYAADFTGCWWYNFFDHECAAVDVGHRCTYPKASYLRADGHRIWTRGATPLPAAPDIYEGDNISSTATAYAGIQFHTFHASDQADWVTFTVPAVDVPALIPYRIETLNLGWGGIHTVLCLYDTDGHTQLACSGQNWSDTAARIQWIPSAAGTYYVEVRPYNASSVGFCDAVYDLMILPVRAQLYLPLALRGG
ncbi:MAG: hypothetical protein JW850_09890 [Thermoflexales bacterium]|nr:hypothetical protein [Thermoflexales bacterium]